jgi:hypothetical protein
MTDTINATPAAAFFHPLAETLKPSLSERLIRGLEAQAADEAHDTAACEELAGQIGDPLVRFLLEMIVDDEQRHHAVLRSMIARLQEEVDFTPTPADSLIPRAEWSPPVDATDEVARAARTLIRDAHEGARHVRHLARQEPGSYDGMFPLLLETIARDSEKHATMLQFILRRIERWSSPSPARDS